MDSTDNTDFKTWSGKQEGPDTSIWTAVAERSQTTVGGPLSCSASFGTVNANVTSQWPFYTHYYPPYHQCSCCKDHLAFAEVVKTLAVLLEKETISEKTFVKVIEALREK